MKTSFHIVLFALITSCNGQVTLPTASVLPYSTPETITVPGPQPKLVTQWAVSSLFPYAKRADPDLQISQYIRKIFQDKSGNIWFGTNDDGVCRLNESGFNYFSTKDGLAGNAIRGIVQDKSGVLWFATNNGLTRYDGKTFTNIPVSNEKNGNDLWSLCLDKTGNIWMGSLAGLFRFDGKVMEPIAIPLTLAEYAHSKFTPKLVWSILEDRSGNLWFGTDGAGLVKFDGKHFTTLTTQQGLCENNVVSLLESKNGDLWFGTMYGGVSRYSGTTFTNYTVSNGLCHSFIWTLYEDQSGNIWMGSAGGGVSRYDGKEFTTFRENEGRTSNHVQCIFQDTDGNLWFGFSGGAFQLKENNFKNITKSGC